MALRLGIALLTLAMLAGCSNWRESRINPATWFDTRDRPETLTPIEQELVVDNRPLVAQVSGLAIDPTPGGIIIRATGLPPTNGWWEGDLVVQTPDGTPVNGVLSFEFRIAPPLAKATPGTPRTREITVGQFVSNQQLAGVTTIEVIGQGNRRSVRR